MKYDIRKLTLAADNLLKTLKNPRHIAIMQNYRKHAMLEVSGRYQEIFVPEMTVPHPFYRLALPHGTLELDGADAVKTFYASLIEGESTVIMLTDEEIVVSDAGFSSEAQYHVFMPGRRAVAEGHEVDDLDGLYIEDRWACMYWPFDEHGRMIGERVYPAPKATLRKCPANEFLTVEEVRATLAPLIASAEIGVLELA